MSRRNCGCRLPCSKHRLVRWALLIVLLVLTACRSGYSPRCEAEFAAMFAHTNRQGLVLWTDEHSYKPGDSVLLWLDNHTDRTIWFSNQALNIRAFRCDDQSGQWVEVDLGFRVGDPVATAVDPISPDERPRLPNYSFPTRWMQTPDLGRIRLVVEGKDRPSDNGTSYVAYVDIEVLP